MAGSIWRRVAGLVVGLAVMAASIGAALAETKIALIVTNESYAQAGARLTRAHDDGARVAEALRLNGFQVTSIRDVATAAALTSAVEGHARRLSTAGAGAIGFLYFGGHSLANRANGSNYLIPTGADLRSTADLPRLGVRMDRLVGILRSAARLNFVTVDACRAYPLPDALVGCVEPRPQRGFVQMVSTRIGAPAGDAGEASRLAAALAAELGKPGVEGGQTMQAAGARVVSASQSRQMPIVVDRQEASTAQRPTPVFVTGTPRQVAPASAATAEPDVAKSRLETKSAPRFGSGQAQSGGAGQPTPEPEDTAPRAAPPAGGAARPAPRSLPPLAGAQPPPPPAIAAPYPAPSAAAPPPAAPRSAPPTTSAPERQPRAADAATPPSTRGVVGGASADWDVVPVFYGTNRKAETNPKRASYTPDRENRLELGHALVTVPKSHKVPNLERPWVYKVPFTQIVIYGEPEDPAKHFTLKEVRALPEAEWLRLIGQRLAASKEYEGHALIFVHGFQTTFDYALFRTAQIAYDLKFDGAPFVYSWPSRGVLGQIAYNYDRESAEGARPHLRRFIELVAAKTGAKRVSFIAHSMGHQVLMPVLEDIRRDKPAGVTISEVILAAPDMERLAFENMARELKGVSRGLTLYASANDVALKAARQYWGGAVRAGDVPTNGPIVVPGLDTIDVSNTSTEWFGLNHSTYAEKTELISDIAKILRGVPRQPPLERDPTLLQVTAEAGGVYWKVPRRSP